MSEKTFHWRDALDPRQQQELAFAELYARDFHHGTDGHNRLMLIAKLAALLDAGAPARIVADLILDERQTGADNTAALMVAIQAYRQSKEQAS